MVEFAINNSVHASTQYTPFFVNGLRHPRLPAQLERGSSLRGGWNRTSKNRSGFCSSRVDIFYDANDADVDLIDIEEGNHCNSKETIAALGNGDDAGVDSIASHLDYLIIPFWYQQLNQSVKGYQILAFSIGNYHRTFFSLQSVTC